jgi:hypothetical protein
VWAHATPDEYGRWLRGLIEQASADVSDPDPLVFINAWNEWAEGAYLEPDEVYGHSYLQATRRARLAAAAGPPVAAAAAPGDETDLAAARARLRTVEAELAAHRRANEWLRAELESRDAEDGPRIAYFAPDAPGWLPRGEIPRLGVMRLERVGPLDEAGALDAQAGRRMRLSGFAVADGVDPAAKEAAACLVLRAIGSDLVYFAPFGARVARPDVVEEFASQNGFAPLLAGFDATVWYEGVEPGPYEVGIVQRGEARVVVTFSGHRVRVPASP